MPNVSKHRKVIWVSQTLPRAQASAADFEALGLSAIISPLLKVRPSANKMDVPRADASLIFTSRNGVRAFCQQHKSRHFPVISVGDATAQLAKKSGFERVTSVDGTSKDVMAWVLSHLPPSTHLLHCAGQDVRGDIVETLQAAGYDAEYRAYYHTQAIETVEPDLSDIDYVALYSPKAARTFANLLDARASYAFKTLSISAATDACLDGLDVKDRLIAEKPSQTSVMARLQLDLHRD